MVRFRFVLLMAALVTAALGSLAALRAADPPKLSILDSAASIQWRDKTLEDAVTDLREKHKLDVSVDRTSIENEGLVTTNIKFNLELRGMSLRNILWLALDGYHLELLEKEDGPQITSRPVAEDAFMLKEYDLKPLGAHVKSDRAVIDLARGCVEAHWKDTDQYGGEIEVADGKLKVRQIPRVHAKLDQLFSQLYQELGTGKKPALTLTERNEKLIADNLAKPGAKKLKVADELPLKDLMTEFANTYSVFVWVDGEGLSDVGVGYTQNVKPQPEGKTGAEVLDSLLAPLDLGAVITHEALLITSKAKANYPDHIRVFNTRVKGGAKMKGTPEEIVRKLQESEEFGLWGDGGGGATVFGPLVVVRQTQPVLNRISKAFYK